MTEDKGLRMELRSVDLEGRNVIGVCVPYNETSYLVPHPDGERIRRGAFKTSIEGRGAKGHIFLRREHEGERVGHSTHWSDDPEGLVGTFHVRRSELGDQTLEELRDGYWPYMSVAFRPLQVRRASDGVPEVWDAYLGHVALVEAPAYEGAEVLAVRTVSVADVLAGFGRRPEVDLSPVPRFW